MEDLVAGCRMLVLIFLGLNPAILGDGDLVGGGAVEGLDEVVVGWQIGDGGPEEGAVGGADEVNGHGGQLLEIVVLHVAGLGETLVGLVLAGLQGSADRSGFQIGIAAVLHGFQGLQGVGLKGVLEVLILLLDALLLLLEDLLQQFLHAVGQLLVRLDGHGVGVALVLAHDVVEGCLLYEALSSNDV